MSQDPSLSDVARTPLECVKYVSTISVSDESLATSQTYANAFRRWMDATPQERAVWAAEAEQARVRERAAAEHVPLTLEALLDKMGWSREYAEHLVQPYCECGDSNDGWDRCQHARDLGLVE